MYLGEEDQISYLANAIFVAHADGATSPRAAAALEEIRGSIGATKNTYEIARKRATFRSVFAHQYWEFRCSG